MGLQEVGKGMDLAACCVGDLFSTGYMYDQGVVWEVIRVKGGLLCRDVKNRKKVREFIKCLEPGYTRYVLMREEEW